MSGAISAIMRTLSAALEWFCIHLAQLLMNIAYLYWEWICLLLAGGDYLLHTFESAHPILTPLALFAYFPVFMFMAFAPLLILSALVSHFASGRTPKQIPADDSAASSLSASQMTLLDAAVSERLP